MQACSSARTRLLREPDVIESQYGSNDRAERPHASPAWAEITEAGRAWPNAEKGEPERRGIALPLPKGLSNREKITMTIPTVSDSETIGPLLPYRAMTSVDLRSPSDAELSAFLPWFVPAHAHFGEPTYLKALRELLGERGLALTYCARKAALDARRQVRSARRP